MNTGTILRVPASRELPPNDARNAQAAAVRHAAGDAAWSASGDARPIRLLVFTSLYPNAVQPRHGVFVEERLRKLVAWGRIRATVVAPVPWFPFRQRQFGRYAAFARVPQRERRHGIELEHPRYPVLPKLGMSMAATLMYRAMLPVLRKHAGDFDLIDAHYFYPDGVAAARLGQALRKPVVITARGSDLNVIARCKAPGRQIRDAAERVAAVVTVSAALKDRATALGAQPDKVTVLRNGVDLERFRLLDRTRVRAELGVAGAVWLAVGHLVEGKGVHVTLAALARTTGATLLIVGTGPEGKRLRQLAARLGVAERVRFLGAIAHAELPKYYNAADALLLASSREGMPNVVLEALACGTPVVAAPFEGAAEVIGAPEAGEIAAERSADAIAKAWLQLRDRGPERAATRRFAEHFGWRPVVAAQCALYARILAAAGAANPELRT